MSKTELAIIGAGPAGLTAAVTAARAGVRVTLVDEYHQAGGQYLKGTSSSHGSPRLSRMEGKARQLLRELGTPGVEVRLESMVLGIEGRRLALHGPAGLGWLDAELLIVATGAREFVAPFPGWTLPGVMTLGAAHMLSKAHGVTPGRRILVAGSGPLLLLVANELARHGARLRAVLEANHASHWIRHGLAGWGNWDRLLQGMKQVHGLLLARVEYRLGRTVIRAKGASELEEVVVARLDRSGRPIPGTERTVPVDTLCLGFGLVPNIELTQLAGCVHQFDPARGGWVPQTDTRMETTVPGLFVAGETAGIGGAEAAMETGCIAGLTVAGRLGRLGDRTVAEAVGVHWRRLRSQLRFARALNTLVQPKAGQDEFVTDDTILCRCEGVSAGEVRRAIGRGARQLDALKVWTRVGQGVCQGRTCGPVLARVMARETGRPVSEAGFFRVRPPLRPVPLGDLVWREGA